MYKVTELLSGHCDAVPLVVQSWCRFGRRMYKCGVIELALGAGLIVGGYVGRDQIIMTGGSVFLALGALRLAMHNKDAVEHTNHPTRTKHKSEDGPV